MAEAPSCVRRLTTLAVLACAAAAAFVLLKDRLTFETLARHHGALAAWRADNGLLAAVAYVAVYAALVAVSAPGGLWMTLAGGLLFGTALGGGLALIGATTGATLIFLAARGLLAEPLRAKAGPWLERLAAGFRENAANYLLALRLTPAAPFFVVNLAPAFFGVPLWTYVWTTLIGAAPATFVFASAGAGLGGVLARGETPDPAMLLRDPSVIGPLLGLAALSLAPVIVKALRRRNAP